ncbi:HAMP domain-containing sensor histidine kinase [Dactylosporangium sp. NPDC049525]|uniref:HAMP domain-containing sensor histidine kinase n=1 Tax=Dactylosporangium sp. NPDC049525 TaxID=3154730 RepID=UPI00342E1233
MRRLFARWWRRRTLHDRLSLLVTGAVAAAVLTVAGIAFAAVFQIQRQQLQSQLDADARSIAAQPDQWRDGPPPGPGGPRRDPRHWRDIGPRWQVLGRDATVAAGSTNGLPVTEGARRVASGQTLRQQEEVYLDGRSYLMLTVPAVRGGGAVQVAVDQSPAHRTLTVFGLLMAAGCILGIGGAAALGRTVARAGLVPVQHLTKAVEDVAVTMDLNRPVPIHGVDEIARLGQSVNTMLAAIGAARQSQRTLVEDASHELRTPLTSIRTNIELLLAVERQPELAHRLPPEERAKLLRDLDAQVGELAALTTELVELAREETTREPAEDVELTDVVDAAVDRVRIRVPAVTFTTDLRPVTVHGRPNELERMLVNVLDNAAKWSPPGGVVHTALSPDGAGWARLVVTDAGPGIDADDLPHVFDRFYRAVAARGMPGSGLGLAIVAQTAAQHGGAVTAGPNDPVGTVITIRLPSA